MMSEPILIDGIPGAHSDSCRCDSCRSMAAAITAQNPDGSYFFSDDELLKLAEEEYEARVREMPAAAGARG